MREKCPIFCLFIGKAPRKRTCVHGLSKITSKNPALVIPKFPIFAPLQHKNECCSTT